MPDSDESYMNYVHPDLREGGSPGDQDKHVAGTESGEGKFDPAEHTVAEVNAYLAGEDVDGRERSRVLRAEKRGQARRGIVGNDA